MPDGSQKQYYYRFKPPDDGNGYHTTRSKADYLKLSREVAAQLNGWVTPKGIIVVNNTTIPPEQQLAFERLARDRELPHATFGAVVDMVELEAVIKEVEDAKTKGA